ncbi:MAG TPA: RidA family protein [Aliidongia sp.]|uniref:RidA family protein n=1 Tax=Aliidongia sp. TaxID=1914230 RepID=UPI002DDD2304|nr:RidA family protein [Aliidongia sp.]HEV2676780.1 RidA family protein [Aliidongia sp.]
MTALRFLQPPGWPRPKGYSNGVAATGETIFVGGQIGWDEAGVFAEGLAAQVERTLSNIVAVLAEAGAGPGDIARLTWYLVDIDDYMARQAEVGAAYRRVLGRHFPVMAVVQVVRLVERQALVEIEATAVKAP